MLYLIAEQLGFPGLLNLVRYISFRAGAATATALAIGLLLGPWFINYLRVRQGKGQPIRADGPQTHLAKRGTPTMGGLLILISVTISVLLWMDLSNPYVWACLMVTLGFGAVGFMIYLMQQLAPGKYTTTHYAFGTGLMGLCGMVTGVISGHLQEMMGYVGYFVLVMVATIPSFLATWFVIDALAEGVRMAVSRRRPRLDRAT